MLWSLPSPSSPAAPSTARDIAELCLPYRRDAKLGHDAVTAAGAAPVAPCARGEDVTRGGPAARDTAPARSRGPRDHLCVSPRNRQDRDRPRTPSPDGPRSKAALQLVRRQIVALAPSWACLAASSSSSQRDAMSPTPGRSMRRRRATVAPTQNSFRNAGPPARSGARRLARRHGGLALPVGCDRPRQDDKQASNESPRHSRSRRRSYWTSACGARDESAEPATMR